MTFVQVEQFKYLVVPKVFGQNAQKYLWKLPQLSQLLLSKDLSADKIIVI